MKKILIFSAIVSGALLAGPICDMKADDVQTQIDYANKHNHKDKIAGLQKALKELKDHCRDDKVLQEAKNDVAKLELKISETNAKIEELKKKDKPKKSKQLEMKLQMQQTELKSAKEDLQKLQDLLNNSGK